MNYPHAKKIYWVVSTEVWVKYGQTQPFQFKPMVVLGLSIFDPNIG